MDEVLTRLGTDDDMLRSRLWDEESDLIHVMPTMISRRWSQYGYECALPNVRPLPPLSKYGLDYLIIRSFHIIIFCSKFSMPCKCANCAQWLMATKSQTYCVKEFLAHLDKSHPYIVVPCTSLRRYIRRALKEDKGILLNILLTKTWRISPQPQRATSIPRRTLTNTLRSTMSPSHSEVLSVVYRRLFLAHFVL